VPDDGGGSDHQVVYHGGAVGVAAVAAAASYENACALLRARDYGSEGSDKRIKGHFDGHSKGQPVAWLPVTQKEADPEAKTAGLGSERGTDATTVC
jgi:hypothetical protein